jgi:DNA-binding PadR family transcriptional regulator
MSVRFALLGLLAQTPRHGYELRSAFEALIGGGQNWDVKPAQVYTTLERLEDAGLVDRRRPTTGGKPEKHVFEITRSGLQALREWLRQSVESKHRQDEFFVKLMTCFLSGEGNPATLIRTQRAELFKQLHDATTLRESYDVHIEMAQILLLDKATMHLEADLRWLDITEQRLEEMKRQPLPKPNIRPRGRPRKGLPDTGQGRSFT